MKYRIEVYKFRCPKCWHIWEMSIDEKNEYHKRDSDNEKAYQKKQGLNK